MRKPAAGKYPDEIIRFIGNQIHAPLDVTIIPGRTLGDLVKYLLAVHVDIYMHCNKCGGGEANSAPLIFYVTIYYIYNFYFEFAMHILMMCWT